MRSSSGWIVELEIAGLALVIGVAGAGALAAPVGDDGRGTGGEPEEAGAARAARASGAPGVTGATAASSERIARGRQVVIEHACGGCHGGGNDPASPDWLSGAREPEDEFLVGACSRTPGATPCFVTRPRNLTPDNTTGMGRFSERQIFNAIRYGLRPGETPDVEITSGTPGEGNFPVRPKYLAPPMPWPAFRHMSDEDLRALAAYLKHGVKPVRHRVADSEGPPDFWVSTYTPERIGRHPAPPFPTAQEQPVAKK